MPRTRTEPSGPSQTSSPQTSYPKKPETGALPRAWLSYQQKIGEVIIIGIERADDMNALLTELQRRIPVHARQYNLKTNRWHVAAAYEDTLRLLFYNFAPVVHPSPAAMGGGRRTRGPRGAHWMAAPHRMRRPTPLRTDALSTESDRRGAWVGMVLALVAAFFVYGLIFSRVGAPTALQESPAAVKPAVTVNGDNFLFPDDCARLPATGVPSYLREACRAAWVRPDPAPARLSADTAFFTATRTASNIRTGPGTSFPILTTVAPNVLLRLTGYNVDGRHVWYQTGFGGWIRSDLVRDAPEGLPFVPAEPDEVAENRAGEPTRWP